ncbi:MAG: SsrA-binding protein SmpB [Ruminococcaceae bacterium]|nr:SsrA-binding protein SmpB [Oscillospiraceae bacterium]
MDSIKLISQNKKAWHDYFIIETIECGISLAGTEVKSLREGKVNLKEAYAQIQNGEVFVKQMHISPFEKGNIFNKDPLRERKLLLHKSEIRRLIGQTKEKGFSLVPTKLYFKNSKVKIEIALVKGKKDYDKREAIAKKDADRSMDRKIKEFNQR